VIDTVTLVAKIQASKRTLDGDDVKLAEYMKLIFLNESLKLIRKAKVRSEDPQHVAGATAMQSQILRIFERSGK